MSQSQPVSPLTARQPPFIRKKIRSIQSLNGRCSALSNNDVNITVDEEPPSSHSSCYHTPMADGGEHGPLVPVAIEASLSEELEEPPRNSIVLHYIDGDVPEIVVDAMPKPTLDEESQKFVESSCFFFDRNHPLRRAAISLITWKWFERMSICIIIVNCCALGMADPCDIDCKTSRCQLLQVIEHAIFAFFAAEMLTKMLALGVWGKNAYLGDGWNCFDCFIVLIGTMEYIFIEGVVNFSAIRAFRVFRPLRAINRIPGLRLLVTLLLDILPMLGNVLIFCFFIFFIFGIGGVQLWSGTLRHRCFFPPSFKNFTSPENSNLSTVPPSFMPPFYRTSLFDFACSPGNGMLTCDQIEIYEKNQESMCAILFEGHPEEITECQRWVPYYSDCRPDGPNPLQGTLSFDNIGFAFIAIFQVISLEGWTEVMYLMQDAYSFWVWTYFVVLIMVGSQFAVNLCLVVIATQFSETKKREVAKMKLERKGSRTSLDTGSLEDVSVYTQLLDLAMHGGMLAYHRIATAVKRPSTNQTRKNKSERHLSNDKSAFKTCWRQFKVKHYKFQAILRRVLEHNIGVGFVMGAIVLNATIMAAEHHNQPESFTHTCESLNLFFTIFFTIELLIKVYAYGFCGYIRDGFNALDFVIVVINLAELFQGSGSYLSVLRTFRLVRVVKIIRFMPTLQRQVMVMLRTIDNIGPFFVLLSFFLYIFALLGMSLFGCRFCPHQTNLQIANDTVEDGELMTTPIGPKTTSCRIFVVSTEKEVNETIEREVSNTRPATQVPGINQRCSRSNFDSLASSLLTVLQVFTQDAWSAVLKDGMKNTSEFASLYFVSLVMIGNYVIFNLLVAILVEGFASENDPATVIPPTPIITKESTPAKERKRLRKKEADEAKRAKKQLKNPIITVQDFDDPNVNVKIIHPAINQQQDSILSTVAIIEPNLCRGFCSLAGSKFRNFLLRCRRFFQQRSAHSLYLFSPDNLFRRSLIAIIGNRYFDNVILLFIVVNCGLIAVERPSIQTESVERRCLDVANYVLNLVFIVEAAVKILAVGLFVGHNTYLRSFWNILDFFLVSSSTVHSFFSLFSTVGSGETKILEIFRVLRILRALRPLRVVNRAPGLKIALETLLVSIRPISNVIVITVAFFLVFAILGLQLFRGCFYRCALPIAASGNATSKNESFFEDRDFELLKMVRNRTDCLANGFDWVNEGFNFDDLPNALMSLFVFATFDGWLDISRDGIDCVAVDQQPIQDYNGWRMVYFIAFLLIVCFFMLNMFVGVVVNNFQKVQKRVNAEIEAKRAAIRREKLLTRLAQQGNVKKKTNLIAMLTRNGTRNKKATPNSKSKLQVSYAIAINDDNNNNDETPFYMRYPRWRRKVYDIVISRYYDLAIAAMTVATMITMAMEFHGMPHDLLLAIRIIAYLFTGLIVVDVAIKFVAYGLFHYFQERWNQLDFFIMASSIAGIIIEEFISFNPTMIQMIRILRIVRVLKLLRAAQGIRRLLNTVSEALPQVGNLSLLFLLLFFIYASVGVELFGKFDCDYTMCEGLSRHANFHNFGMSLLTLFRIFTGDNWNGLLKDMMTFSDQNHCHDMLKLDLPSNHTGLAIECTIIHVLSPPFFVSFVLISQFVLINVVIAVLMGSLEGSHYFENEKATQIGEDIADKVAVLEGVVDSVCPDLVNQLQDQLQASREDVVRIVSTEYALRQPLSVENNDLAMNLLGNAPVENALPLNSSHSTLSGSGAKRNSRESSLIAINQHALQDIFVDLKAEMRRPANAFQPVSAINWFVELRRSPSNPPATSLDDSNNSSPQQPRQYLQHNQHTLVRSHSANHFQKRKQSQQPHFMTGEAATAPRVSSPPPLNFTRTASDPTCLDPFRQRRSDTTLAPAKSLQKIHQN